MEGWHYYPQLHSYVYPCIWKVKWDNIFEFISFEKNLGLPLLGMNCLPQIKGINVFYFYDTIGSPLGNEYCCVMGNAIRWFSISKPDSIIAEYKYADYCEKKLFFWKSRNFYVILYRIYYIFNCFIN
jgi:hypothetical protein